jgi:hypothetical protein
MAMLRAKLTHLVKLKGWLMTRVRLKPMVTRRGLLNSMAITKDLHLSLVILIPMD